MKAFVGVCFVAAVLAIGMPKAEAKGIMIINTGEDIVEIGEVKPELRSDLETETAAGVKVGMMYSRFGVFWLDIWRWDKKYVLFHDTTFWEITEAQAKEVATSIDVPFTMTLPPGLLVLLGIIGIVVVAKVLGRDKGGSDAPPSEPATTG